jgi:hypothetical protein
MRIADLNSGPAKLAEAWEILQLRWQVATEQWNDPVSREFEDNYLAPLKPRVASTLEKMRLLGQVLAKAEEECS